MIYSIYRLLKEISEWWERRRGIISCDICGVKFEPMIVGNTTCVPCLRKRPTQVVRVHSQIERDRRKNRLEKEVS